MAQATQVRQRKLLEAQTKALLEAHLRKVYADVGVRAGEDNLHDLMYEYLELSNEAKRRYDNLQVEIRKLKK